MKHGPIFPSQGKSTCMRWLFASCFLGAVAPLLWVPLVGAGPFFQQSSTIQFHGHQVSTVTSADIGRWDARNGPLGSTEPVPIPGGLVLPPQIHVFAPGPVDQGFQGLDVEPSVITNYRGFSAIGYPGGFGTASDSDGNSYDLISDMRVFQGEYVSSDGTHHRGTFAFI
jgi:hypothetical protein